MCMVSPKGLLLVVEWIFVVLGNSKRPKLVSQYVFALEYTQKEHVGKQLHLIYCKAAVW